MITRVNLIINGVPRPVICDPEKDNLAVVIRRMGLTGTKVGCGTGVCGACSLLLNGEVVRFLYEKDEECPRRQCDYNDRRHRHTAASASAAAGLDHIRRRPVRFLHTGLYCFLLRSARAESRPDPRRSPRMVPETPEYLPLHGLQTAH